MLRLFSHEMGRPARLIVLLISLSIIEIFIWNNGGSVRPITSLCSAFLLFYAIEHLVPSLTEDIRRASLKPSTGWKLLVVVSVVLLTLNSGIVHAADKALDQFPYDEFGSWAEWVTGALQGIIAVAACYIAWVTYSFMRNQAIQLALKNFIDTVRQVTRGTTREIRFTNVDSPDITACFENLLLLGLRPHELAQVIKWLSSVGGLSTLEFKWGTGQIPTEDNGLPKRDPYGPPEATPHSIRLVRLDQLGRAMKGRSLAKQDLAAVDFSHAVLEEFNFSDCYLVGATFAFAKLRQVNFQRADLQEVVFFLPAQRKPSLLPIGREKGKTVGCATVDDCSFQGAIIPARQFVFLARTATGRTKSTLASAVVVMSDGRKRTGREVLQELEQRPLSK